MQASYLLKLHFFGCYGSLFFLTMLILNLPVAVFFVLPMHRLLEIRFPFRKLNQQVVCVEPDFIITGRQGFLQTGCGRIVLR